MVIRRSTPPKPPFTGPKKLTTSSPMNRAQIERSEIKFRTPESIQGSKTVQEDLTIGRGTGTTNPNAPGGYDPMAALALILKGGRSGGGGGGGGSAGMSPAQRKAIQDAYDQSYAAEIAGLESRDEQIRKLSGEGRDRANTMIGGLNTAATNAGTSVAGAYSGADAALAQLMSDYANRQSALGAGAGQTLQAFGVAPEVMGGSDTAGLLAQYRAGLAGLGGVAQADLAQRPLTYQALSADYLQGLDQSERAALAKTIADRQRIDAENNVRRAELAAQQ